jgi:hypothetical protein
LRAKQHDWRNIQVQQVLGWAEHRAVCDRERRNCTEQAGLHCFHVALAAREQPQALACEGDVLAGDTGQLGPSQRSGMAEQQGQWRGTSLRQSGKWSRMPQLLDQRRAC